MKSNREVTKLANYFDVIIKKAQDFSEIKEIEENRMIANVKSGLLEFISSIDSIFKNLSLSEAAKAKYIEQLNRIKTTNDDLIDAFKKDRKKSNLSVIYSNLSIVYDWFKEQFLFKNMSPETVLALKNMAVLAFKKIVPKLKDLYRIAK